MIATVTAPECLLRSSIQQSSPQLSGELGHTRHCCYGVLPQMPSYLLRTAMKQVLAACLLPMWLLLTLNSKGVQPGVVCQGKEISTLLLVQCRSMR